MRVALINSLYYPDLFGGAERSVQQLAEGLVARGHDISVMATPVDNTAKMYHHNGVRIFGIPIQNFYHPYSGERSKSSLRRAMWHVRDTSNPNMARSVASALAEVQPQLVSTHSLSGHSVAVWGAAKALKLPIVHTLRDYYLLCPKSAMYDHRAATPCVQQCTVCRAFSAPRKSAARQLDGVVGISNFILDTHVRLGFFSDRSIVRQVIHNGYDAGGAPKLQGASSPFRFGFLGQLIREKGLELLLDGFSRLPKGEATLQIFGKGDDAYVRQLRERAQGIEGILWRGFVPAAQAMNEIDALVIPSLWHEPFGRVVIEAFGYGVPVIGSMRGGIPEIIEESRNGYLFDPSSPQTLERAMKAMLDNPPSKYLQMRAEALARSKNFSLKAMLDSYEALFSGIKENGKVTPGSES